jgi:hypothetical protein
MLKRHKEMLNRGTVESTQKDVESWILLLYHFTANRLTYNINDQEEKVLQALWQSGGDNE